MMHRRASEEPDRGPASELDAKTLALVRLSARLATPNPDGWRRALRAAARVAGRTEIEEVLLQSHLFVGFPVVLNAFIIWVEESGEPPEAAAPPPIDVHREGESLCRAVYGRAYERLRENVRGLSPVLDRWMVEDGYGKTLSRAGLAVEVRELCIVALLAAAGHERQLRAHLFGALNVGAVPRRVEAALAEGIAASVDPRWAMDRDPGRLRQIWDRVRRVGAP